MIGGNFQSPNPHRSQFAGGLRMDEATKMESHQTVKAFVDGGVQDACDDACSICLEVFCESDPSTVTTCKHEFHLQCILEWCQRSSQCPMCWQPISLKDSTSQELLEAVEEERSFRVDRSRNTTIFHHSAFEDFELRHLPIDPNDAELEERIIQHLAAAAAMRRACHITRREGQQGSSRAQGHPQFLVLSTHPNMSSTSSDSASSAHRGGQTEAVPAIISANPSLPLATAEEESSGQAVHISSGRADQIAALPSENNVTASSRPALSSRSSSGQSAPVGQDTAGPSDFHSFSETFKSRLNSVSMRYRDSFSRSTQGWKEKLFSRSTSMADIGSGVRREVSAGISTVSRMFERLETREPTQANSASNEGVTERHSRNLANDSNTSTSHAGNSR